MLNISCPNCNHNGGRALGITNVLIRCCKCKKYYLFVSDAQGKSSTQIINKQQDLLKDNY